MLTRWFVFSVVFIAILAIISNTSPIGLTAIQNQIFLSNCPTPINGGIATNLNIDGSNITYDVVRDNSTSDYHLTVFNCAIVDPDIPTYSVSTTVYTTANNWFNVGLSYLAYLMNVIGDAGVKIQSYLTIIGFLLSPINFNILGFTISDIGGIGLIVISFTYITCYIGIGLFLYKALNPFGGSV